MVVLLGVLTSSVSWLPRIRTPLNWTRSPYVFTATACLLVRLLAASLKSLDMVRLETEVLLAAMVTEALPAVPYVPPPGLLVPEALLNTMTTELALEPSPTRPRNGLVDGMLT